MRMEAKEDEREGGSVIAANLCLNLVETFDSAQLFSAASKKQRTQREDAEAAMINVM